MDATRPRWSPQAKLTVSLLIVALFVYLLSRFSAVLAPMTLAVILAFVLSPLVKVFQDRFGMRRPLAVILTYLVLLAVMVTLPAIILPVLAAQVAGLNLDFQRILRTVEDMLGHRYLIAGQVINVDDLIQQAIGSLQGVFEPVFGQTLSLAVEVISSVVWVIFILVVSFYLIKDGQALRTWLENMVPAVYRKDYVRLRDEINHIWAAFFRGQLVLAVVVSVIFTVIGFCLGLPFALAMGVFAGLLEFLPSIGHGIWLVVASLLAFFGGSTWIPVPNWVFMLIVIGLHLVYQQFDLNYLIPRIIGRSVHLPPLVVILGIVTGAVLAGVLGILIAAPTIASARVIGRYVYANLFDLDPFAAHAAPPLPPPDPRWWRPRPVATGKTGQDGSIPTPETIQESEQI
jgi:predicted PurR-regulated permease PerM